MNHTRRAASRNFAVPTIASAWAVSPICVVPTCRAQRSTTAASDGDRRAPVRPRRTSLAVAWSRIAENQPYDIGPLIHANQKSPDEGAVPRGPPPLRQDSSSASPARAGPVGKIVANPPGAPSRALLQSTRRLEGRRFVLSATGRVQHRLVTISAVPWCLPGPVQNSAAIIARRERSITRSRIHCAPPPPPPKVKTLITRKAYGGAYCFMSSKHIVRPTELLAWPCGGYRGAGPEGPSTSLYIRENREGAGSGRPPRARAPSFREKFANALLRRRRAGFIDKSSIRFRTRSEADCLPCVLETKRRQDSPKSTARPLSSSFPSGFRLPAFPPASGFPASTFRLPASGVRLSRFRSRVRGHFQLHPASGPRSD